MLDAALREAFDAAREVADVKTRHILKQALRASKRHVASLRREAALADATARARERVLVQAIKDDLITRAAHDAALANRAFVLAETDQTNQTNHTNQTRSIQERAREHVEKVEASVIAMVAHTHRAEPVVEASGGV